MRNLALASGHAILPATTLIILDEIQECNAALNALKYFHENAPEYHIAGAGSLLGIALSKPASFPVGKVDFLSLFPMTFTECLLANGDGKLVDYLRQIDVLEAVPELFHSELQEKLKQYFVTGGMPEAVFTWVETRDISLVQSVFEQYARAYERDFARTRGKKRYPKLSTDIAFCPFTTGTGEQEDSSTGLSRKEAGPGVRGCPAMACQRGYSMYRMGPDRKPGLPLSAYDDLSAFKVFACDLGLLRRLFPSGSFGLYGGIRVLPSSRVR